MRLSLVAIMRSGALPSAGTASSTTSAGAPPSRALPLDTNDAGALAGLASTYLLLSSTTIRRPLPVDEARDSREAGARLVDGGRRRECARRPGRGGHHRPRGKTSAFPAVIPLERRGSEAVPCFQRRSPGLGSLSSKGGPVRGLRYRRLRQRGDPLNLIRVMPAKGQDASPLHDKTGSPYANQPREILVMDTIVSTPSPATPSPV